MRAFTRSVATGPHRTLQIMRLSPALAIGSPRESAMGSEDNPAAPDQFSFPVEESICTMPSRGGTVEEGTGSKVMPISDNRRPFSWSCIIEYSHRHCGLAQSQFYCIVSAVLHNSPRIRSEHFKSGSIKSLLRITQWFSREDLFQPRSLAFCRHLP
jgi:hypothetical protein